MSQEVKQWLAEIKTLQQKVAQSHQEQEEAFASAANWRSLYETEAKQRRMEAHLARQAIDSLKAELQAINHPVHLNTSAELIQTEVAQTDSVPELQAWLIQTLQECDRLVQALHAEQAAHIETRKNLTTALGDAIDQLNQERQAQGERQAARAGSLPEPIV